MSAKGLFTTGFTQREVKAIQKRAKALLLEGKTIMGWNDGGGTSVTKQFTMPVADVLEECAYALKRMKDQAAGGEAAASRLSTLPHRLPL